MKTPMTYGLYMALAGAFLAMAFYFLGFHTEPEKFDSAQTIGTMAGLAIPLIFMILGIQEKRAQTPANKKWGYGSAFVTALLIGVFASVFSVVFNAAYFFQINPGFSELVLEVQLDKMEAQGVDAAAIEQAEPVIKTMTSPVAMVITGFLMGLIGNTVIALVVAIFLRKRNEDTPPPIA